MTWLDPRMPVLVGVGQCSPAERTAETSPLALTTTAARLAVADTGVAEGTVLERIRSIGVADSMCWQAPDPGRVLADALGAAPRETVTTSMSGTSPLDLLTDACEHISAGLLDVALLAGAETVKALHEGRLTDAAEQQAEATPTRKLGTDRHPSHPAEEASGLYLPIHFYPLFENAIRAAAGRDITAHEQWVASLWARFAEVAKTNPRAWNNTGPDTQTIATASRHNRMVSFPYRKLTTANIHVDQGAALILSSAEAADAMGIARDRWVFVHSTGTATDHWYVGERAELHRSPAINAIGRAMLGHAGIGIDEVDHLDLYSCFPSAVQVAATELGIDLDDPHRPPTVTGGLTFAGGPGSNYVMHSLATLAERIRQDPGSIGLATGVGWFLTKHAAALLSGTPPAHGYTQHSVQDQVDLRARREIAEGHLGQAVIETYTIGYDREGNATTAHVACLLADRRRAFAASKDADVIARLLSSEPIGDTVTLLPDARFA
ncbi:MAG: acetyl-CoA acetyltransferase [Haloechinothrix sp.]